MTSEFILTFPLICFILTIFCSGACVRACLRARHTIYGWGNKLEGKKSFGNVVL